MREDLNTNEAGFTLLESLITLALSSVVLLLFTSILSQLAQANQLMIQDSQNISTSESKIYGSRQIEWHIFLAQLENYLEGSKLIESNSNQLIVIEKASFDGAEQSVRYGQARSGQQNFYRRYNNGYHEMLTAIKKFELSVAKNCLTLFFEFQNGEKYQGRMWINSWRENNGEENEVPAV